MGQGMVVLVSPLLTRLYAPESFGVLAVYASIISILGAVASLRYEAALPLPEEDEVAVSLLVLCFVTVVTTSVLCGVGIWVMGDALVRWTNTPMLKPYLWLIPLGFLGLGVYQTLNYWAIRNSAFTRIARASLSQGTTQVSIQIGLGLLRLGPFGLLLGEAVGRASGSITLSVSAWRQDKDAIKEVSLLGMRRAARRYRRFPLLSSGSALLNSAGIQLPSLLLAVFYGPQVAGWFLLGQRVMGALMYLVGTAVGQAYISIAAQLNREDPAAMLPFFSRTALRLFLASIGLVVLLEVVGGWLFEWVFGAEWSTAGLYLQILAPVLLLQFTVSPLSQTVFVLERQDIQLLWDAFRAGTVVLVFAAANRMGASPEVAIGAYAVALLMLYAWLLLMYRRALADNLRR